MKPYFVWACTILIAVLFSSCALAPSTIEPKLSPSENPATAAVTTEESGNSNQPTSPAISESPSENPGLTPEPATQISTQAVTATETQLSIRVANTPTFTPTPTTPNATIQILAPGPTSKVVSPIHVSAYLKPGARGIIRVELLGEDGRLLGRKVLVYAPELQVHMLTDMEFEIPGVAEAGRLAIITEDPQGRTLAVSSVNVLLMSMGDEDINPPGDLLEDIIIQQPARSMFIQGEKVLVSGLARTQGNDPLLVELISQDGTHIGPTRLVSLPASVDGGYSPFTVEIPYGVSAPTWVRLEVYENSGRIPGTLHLSSIEILLGQ